MPTIAQETVKETGDEYLNFNKGQLFDGKKKDGQDITPSYFNDPFFKTVESAAKYSEWKNSITPSLKRTPGTPNLFINGYFYSTLTISLSGDDITVNTGSLGDEITDKYGDGIYGLNMDSRIDYLKLYYIPKLKPKVTDILKVEFL